MAATSYFDGSLPVYSFAGTSKMYVPSNIKTDYIFDFTQTFSFWTFHVQKLLRTVFVKILKRLSLSLSANLCNHYYWLCWLRQASHRKMIQSSALRPRLWRFKILKCPSFSGQNIAKKLLIQVKLRFLRRPENWKKSHLHSNVKTSQIFFFKFCSFLRMSEL